MEHVQPDISVVILCYRAENFAAVFIKQVQEILEQRRLNYELVLVANYQAALLGIDKTPEIVRALAHGDPRLVVVAKEKQGMMGWDMRSGLAAATGAAIAVIDGDGQMPPEDIIKVYDTLVEGHHDIAKTYRDQRFDGWFRILISVVYNLVVKVLFPRVAVRDVNSKPKIFTSAALKKLQLQSDDWFIDAEIILKATRLGLSIGEVSTIFHVNENRKSFIKGATIFEFIKNLIRFRMGLYQSKQPRL